MGGGCSSRWRPWSWRSWPWSSTTSCRPVTRSCATSPCSGTSGSGWRAFGPELRQYIVTCNDEERPFSRDERRWIYTSAKDQDNTFGFGTDTQID